ncbi:hypothetical protein OPT61_g1112 [Boeremia exigua]|uniref:Uncharacterized protein n=1 Tax=Boeremia exigua TaxID=749465 RepID=A0ACC2IRT7_9PLEO|nr:hypothetical protein OPT61_g1112 [Boeremia exigua]
MTIFKRMVAHLQLWTIRRPIVTAMIAALTTGSSVASAGAGGAGAFVIYGIPAVGAALVTIVLGYRMRTRATIRRLKLDVDSLDEGFYAM